MTPVLQQMRFMPIPPPRGPEPISALLTTPLELMGRGCTGKATLFKYCSGQTPSPGWPGGRLAPRGLVVGWSSVVVHRYLASIGRFLTCSSDYPQPMPSVWVIAIGQRLAGTKNGRNCRGLDLTRERDTAQGGSIPEMHRAHAPRCSPGWRLGPPPVEAMGPALSSGERSSSPREMIMQGGGSENGYTGDGDVAYRKCTTHTRHRTRVPAWPVCHGAVALPFDAGKLGVTLHGTPNRHQGRGKS